MAFTFGGDSKLVQPSYSPSLIKMASHGAAEAMANKLGEFQDRDIRQAALDRAEARSQQAFDNQQTTFNNAQEERANKDLAAGALSRMKTTKGFDAKAALNSHLQQKYVGNNYVLDKLAERGDQNRVKQSEEWQGDVMRQVMAAKGYDNQKGVLSGFENNSNFTPEFGFKLDKMMRETQGDALRNKLTNAQLAEIERSKEKELVANALTFENFRPKPEVNAEGLVTNLQTATNRANALSPYIRDPYAAPADVAFDGMSDTEALQWKVQAAKNAAIKADAARVARTNSIVKDPLMERISNWGMDARSDTTRAEEVLAQQVALENKDDKTITREDFLAKINKDRAAKAKAEYNKENSWKTNKEGIAAQDTINKYFDKEVIKPEVTKEARTANAQAIIEKVAKKYPNIDRRAIETGVRGKLVQEEALRAKVNADSRDEKKEIRKEQRALANKLALGSATHSQKMEIEKLKDKLSLGDYTSLLKIVADEDFDYGNEKAFEKILNQYKNLVK